MKVKVQVVIITDDGHETTRDVACVERFRSSSRIPTRRSTPFGLLVRY